MVRGRGRGRGRGVYGWAGTVNGGGCCIEYELA